MSEKKLSFECAMQIVGEERWIHIKDIERLVNFIQNQQATIESLERENEKLKEELKDANDEVDYWKDIVGRYRNSAKLNFDKCTIIQGNKTYVGQIRTFVKYENHSSIELYDLKEIDGGEYE